MKVAELVAENLRLAMGSRGLSQTSLSQKSGLTIQTVNAFCNGRATVMSPTLEQLAKALELPPENLFSHPGEPGDLDRGALAREVAQAVVAELKKTSNELGLMFPDSEPDLRKIIELLAVFKPHQMTEALSYVVEMHQHVMDSRAANAKKKAQSSA